MKIPKISAKRRRGLEFHIHSDDYFGTLATALFLLQESMDGNAKDTLKRFVWDLMFLQGRYRIIEKKLL
jgi:hypothetical protein